MFLQPSPWLIFDISLMVLNFFNFYNGGFKFIFFHILRKHSPSLDEKHYLVIPFLKGTSYPEGCVKGRMLVYQQESNFAFSFHVKAIISFLMPFLSVICGPSGSHKLFPSIRNILLRIYFVQFYHVTFEVSCYTTDVSQS